MCLPVLLCLSFTQVSISRLACHLLFLIHIGTSESRRGTMRGVRESDDAPLTPRPDTDQPSSWIESSSYHFRMPRLVIPVWVLMNNSRTRRSKYLHCSDVNLLRSYSFLRSATSTTSRRVMILQSLSYESRDNQTRCIFRRLRATRLSK